MPKASKRSKEARELGNAKMDRQRLRAEKRAKKGKGAEGEGVVAPAVPAALVSSSPASEREGGDGSRSSVELSAKKGAAAPIIISDDDDEELSERAGSDSEEKELSARAGSHESAGSDLDEEPFQRAGYPERRGGSSREEFAGSQDVARLHEGAAAEDHERDLPVVSNERSFVRASQFGEADRAGRDTVGTDIDKGGAGHLGEAGRAERVPRLPKSQRDDPEYTTTLEDRLESQGGVARLEDDSDFDGEHDPMLEAVRAMQRRKSMKEEGRSTWERSRGSGNTPKPIPDMDGNVNLQSEWERSYSLKGEAFFRSPHARMLVPGGAERLATGQIRATSYKGVGVNHNNNFDVRYCFERRFANVQSESYVSFCTFMGQVIRAGIANERLEMDAVWKKGELFKIAGNKAFWTLFIDYFIEKSQGGTLKHKSIMGTAFCDCARSWFSLNPLYGDNQGKNMRFDAKIQEVIDLWRGKSREVVNNWRKRKAHSKEDEKRLACNRLIEEEDVEFFRNHALSMLDGILRYLRDRFEDTGARDTKRRLDTFQDVMERNQRLLSKWMMNFTAMLLMFGGGQRNQVYAGLKAPTVSELGSFEREQGGVNSKVPLKMYICENEKKPRDMRIPFIMFSPEIFHFVHFHVELVLPYLHLRFQVRTANRDADHLLLNTRTGRPVESDSIRRTITKWCENTGRGIHVTPNGLRSAYATYMMRRFANRHTNGNAYMQETTEQEFIVMLAGVMNTGVEQIRNVYASAIHKDYANHVAEVFEIVRCGDHEGLPPRDIGYRSAGPSQSVRDDHSRPSVPLRGAESERRRASRSTEDEEDGRYFGSSPRTPWVVGIGNAKAGSRSERDTRPVGAHAESEELAQNVDDEEGRCVSPKKKKKKKKGEKKRKCSDVGEPSPAGVNVRAEVEEKPRKKLKGTKASSKAWHRAY